MGAFWRIAGLCILCRFVHSFPGSPARVAGTGYPAGSFWRIAGLCILCRFVHDLYSRFQATLRRPLKAKKTPKNAAALIIRK
jgi:hypothetical protein